MIEVLPKPTVYICTPITHLQYTLRAQYNAHTMAYTAKKKKWIWVL